MKLLIADDEILTRNGLVTSIDWKSLGIDQVFEASDGMEAYNTACTSKPDIILSDIRMPRLSGIEFAEKIKEILPDTSLIFMSGYSDKEYLKAAIRLKAITYVEKPLDLQEVKDSVQEAINEHQTRLQTRSSMKLQSKETSSRLAQLLTRPYNEKQEEVDELTDKLSIHFTPQTYFTSFIVKLRSGDFNAALLKEPFDRFQDILEHYHLKSLAVRLHNVHYVFHILGEKVPSDTVFSSIENYLKEMFSPFGDFYISRGETVRGITKVYQSYASTVILLQSSFFTTVNSVLDQKKLESDATSKTVPSGSVEQFLTLLVDNNQEDTRSFLDNLYQVYFNNTKLLPNQVKDIYFRLFSSLTTCRQKLKLTSESTGQESILQHLEECFSFDEMHQLLCTRTEELFQSIEGASQEDSTIFMIKDYISKHYSEERLSIKEIGDHVFLSASYICTYFKTQTGQTLNQYITEYRMERAMQLLQDKRYAITDISEKVGYNNGNYFGKSFKKFTGLTPSQYRDKMLG